MRKKYEVNLFSSTSLDNYIKDLEKLKDAITSKDFMNFIADKCMLEINRISNERLDGIRDDDVFAEDVARYRANHKVEIQDDIIIISNATMADLSHVSAETLANYPNGFSIAKAIEFGTGIWGESNGEFDWTTQLNPKRDYAKGWYYEKDGQLHWSKGLGGKYIYGELLNSVEQNFQKWFDEYIEQI